MVKLPGWFKFLVVPVLVGLVVPYSISSERLELYFTPDVSYSVARQIATGIVYFCTFVVMGATALLMPPWSPIRHGAFLLILVTSAIIAALERWLQPGMSPMIYFVTSLLGAVIVLSSVISLPVLYACLSAIEEREQEPDDVDEDEVHDPLWAATKAIGQLSTGIVSGFATIWWFATSLLFPTYVAAVLIWIVDVKARTAMWLGMFASACMLTAGTTLWAVHRKRMRAREALPPRRDASH